MKNILVLLLCLITVNIYAQIGEPEISDRDWYLTEMNINGMDIEIPVNEELQEVNLDFRDTTPHFNTTVCNTLGGTVERLLNGMDEFVFPDGIGQTLIQCKLLENFEFEETYFDFFYENIDEIFSFFLTIVDDPPNEYYYLELRVPNGDYVVYSDTPRLSVENQERNTFFALPNPVQDQFLIKAPQTINVVVAVYDVLGQKVFEETTKSNTQINLSAINEGMYLVKVTTLDGQIQTFKLFKN